jgi:chromosome partitioning protein
VAHVLSFVNLKGGVGKTSCCLHLGGAFAQLGHRVLLCDNDPQSSLTAGFLGLPATRQLDPAGTIAAVYAGDDPYPEQVIRRTAFAGFDLLAGSRFAASYNVPDPHKCPYEAQARLREFLAPVRDLYDLVLIDCPPNLHLCSWAAMAAADHLVVPLQVEDFGSQGTIDVGESATLVRSVINHGLGLLGYIISMYQARRALHQAFAQKFREAHGPSVFNTSIPESVDYAEAVTAHKPITYHKPRGAAAKAIRALATEVLTRLEVGLTESGRGAA